MSQPHGPFDLDSIRPSSPFLNESHQAWRATVRRFVDTELMPHVTQWDEAEHVPDEIFRRTAEIGTRRLGYPEEFGGISEGIDEFHKIVQAEEFARLGSGGVSSALGVHGIALPPILAHGPEWMKREVVPPVLDGLRHASLAITEPSGGSDVASIQTRAVRDGDEFVVTGAKTYITGGMRADWFTTAVRTGGEGRGGLSLLLIPAGLPGFGRTRLDKMGWWASDTATLYFDAVRVPARNLIGVEGRGFQAIMVNFNSERLGMAASCTALARVCIAEAIDWARQRHTFGKRLADHQVIRHKIADMVRQVNATTAYLENCAWRVQQGEQPAADLALLKVQATLTMESCAREAMQILGGAGYMRGNRVERIYREVRVNAIGGGSEEIMRDLAARQLGL